MNKNNFGYLMICNLSYCDGDIGNKKLYELFINELVIDIMKMKIIGTPQYEYFDYTPFNVENDLVGYSATAIISLSSITIHICEISKRAYIDIFTCCQLDKEMEIKIIDCINRYFEPKTITNDIIIRK